MKSSNANSIIFTKEQAEKLSKIRILQKNLIHVHGFPKTIAKTEKLKSNEYFGQYGKIIKAMIVYKKNPDTKRKIYSAYITYSNEKEAAFAILCVDSLLVEGKIIRAFFGTTKYCNYFLNNDLCPNLDKCFFLHRLINDNDIIIDDKTSFSYDDHINLSKKIIQFYDPKTKDLVSKIPKQEKNVFPNIDFIFLSEKEKEKYFVSGIISYTSSDNNEHNNILLNNSYEQNDSENNIDNINNSNINISINNYNNSNIFIENNSIKNININTITNSEEPKLLNINQGKKYQINDKTEYECLKPLEMHKLFNNSITHILKVRTFFSYDKIKFLRKMELEYFKNDLAKNGIDINELLEGCLDTFSDMLN